MPTTWKQSDVFPIIAQIIRDLYAKQSRYITHDEMTAGLLGDPAAARMIGDAQREQDEKRSLEWLAHNMVAWFSQRITVGQSDWDDVFDRKKIDGKWAYKPEDQ